MAVDAVTAWIISLLASIIQPTAASGARHQDLKFVTQKLPANQGIVERTDPSGVCSYEFWAAFGHELFRYGSASGILEIRRHPVAVKAPAPGNRDGADHETLGLDLALDRLTGGAEKLTEYFGFFGLFGSIGFRGQEVDNTIGIYWKFGDLVSADLFSGKSSSDSRTPLEILKLWGVPADVLGKKVGDTWETKEAETFLLKRKYESFGTMGGRPAARLSLVITPVDRLQNWVVRATQYVDTREGVLLRFDGRYHDGAGVRVTISLKLLGRIALSS
jgi:hypothetical protein